MSTEGRKALEIATVVSGMLDGRAVEVCPSPAELGNWISTLLERYGCEVRPAPDLAPQRVRFGGQEEEAWTDQGSAERYGLRYSLMMAETTFRRLLQPHPEVDRNLLESFRSILAARPSPSQAYYQECIDAESSLRRALAIRRELGPGLHSVLFVGDDDATSIALALLEPSWPLWVIDIDERLLEFLRLAAERLGATLVTEVVDVRFGPPLHLKHRFSGVALDPPRLFKFCLEFLRFSASCLSRVEPSKVFWSDHPEGTLGFDALLNELSTLGLVMLSIDRELHRYDPAAMSSQSAGSELEKKDYFEFLDRLSATFRLDPRWLPSLASLSHPWSHLYILGRGSDGPH